MTENPEVLVGDCREVLPTLEAQSVQTCVTSPPYWGLRDYGTAQWEGGEEGCEHKRFNGYTTGLVGTDDAQRNGKFFKGDCLICGARRIDSQLGLESTPDDYITDMVAVFREVWRVLRDDGTCWINLGDSYGQNQGKGFDTNKDGGTRKAEAATFKVKTGLKPKDLCGIPWRLAFALQSDGWYLRSDIIWHKPNPMPESVTDRPTKSHEYIFLLSKRERYFYDADAIREPATEPRRQSSFRGGSYCDHSSFNNSDKGITKTPLHSFNLEPRNKRTVWTVATQPYAEAHFATFPEDLIKPCILAGSRVGDTVLDPFAGSGTTGKVALELGRRAVLIELNPAYIKLARDRTFVTPGFF